MAKSYKIENDKITTTGKIVLGEKPTQTVEKSITMLGGGGEWKQLHGVKLFIDPSGVCIKGPDIFISRKWDDLQRLTFQDTNTVMLSVMRAVGATNKSFEDEYDKQNKEKILTEAKNYLNLAIERNNKNRDFFNSRSNLR